MPLNQLIPTLWSARLLANLQKALVFAQEGVINRDYEGEIRQMGDKLRISQIGVVTVDTYTKNTAIPEPQILDDSQTTLEITQARYFNFMIDDIDRAQQNPDVMDAALAKAAYHLAEKADTFLATNAFLAPPENLIGTDLAPITDLDGAGKAYEYLVDLGLRLTESNVPYGERWVVLPPWYVALLRKDARFIHSGTAAGDALLRNGQIGMAAGFTVLESNNVAVSTDKFKIMAGYQGAITYAEQINSVEAYRPERRFADAVKGLHLYGSKLIQPRGIAVLTATRPA
jgi:P22 coat protein - gene protein 5